MASPISAGEIYAMTKFAYDVLRSCQKAKGDFDQIANEVSAMRTVLQLAHLECENPVSILNVTDSKDKSNRKALAIHLKRCKKALEDVEACLKRYSNMSAMDRLAWSLRGRDEVKNLESNLSSFATQLDSFFVQLSVKGVGAVWEGIGRIEEALERLGGDDGAAVHEVMQGHNRSRTTPQRSEQYKSIIADYAKQVSQSKSFAPPTPRARTPESRGRKGSLLSVPNNKDQVRSKSANTPGAKNLDVRRNSVSNTKPLVKGRPKHELECWLIQIKTGQIAFVDWEFSEKMVQCR